MSAINLDGIEEVSEENTEDEALPNKQMTTQWSASLKDLSQQQRQQMAEAYPEEQSLPEKQKLRMRHGSVSLKDLSQQQRLPRQQQQQATNSSNNQLNTYENGATQGSSSAANPPLPPPPPPPQAPPQAPPSAPPKAKGSKYITVKKSDGGLPFDFRDLMQERKKLKRPDEVLKQVDVERLNLFDKHKKYTYMPLVDSREYLRTLRAEIHSISFDSVEQLSDAFLFSLFHCKINLQLLNWISLSGPNCQAVWILMRCRIMQCPSGSKLFAKIQLLGCNKVTERSVYQIRKLVPKLNKMYLDATNCGVVPVDSTAHLGSYETTGSSKETKPDIYVNGCPMISPLMSEMVPDQKHVEGTPSPYRKLVILTPNLMSWSPLAVLSGEKDVAYKPGLVVKQGWRPFKEHNMQGVKSSAAVFNVFQVPNAKGLPELILSPGSILVFAFILYPSMSKDQTAKQLATDVASVLAKHDDCSYVLLGMSSDKDNVDYTETVESILKKTKRYLSSWLDHLQTTIRYSIDTNWKMAALDYQDQEVLAANQRLLRHGRLLCPEDSSQESNPPLVASEIKVGQTQHIPMQACDLQFLKDIVQADDQHFGWNRQAFYSDKVMKYSADLSKNGLPITPLRDVCKSQKMEGVYKQTAKMMEYCALWGHALYYPHVEGLPVVTDFKFLAAVIDKIFFQSAPRKCDIRCLGDQISCWTEADLMAIGKEMSQDQKKLLLRVLEKHGCLFKFAMDPWSSFNDVPFVYVFFEDFPQNPTIALDQFWPEEPNSPKNQKDKYYFCSPGLPQSFFPNLLRHVLKFGSHKLVWKNGAIMLKGYQTILVEKVLDANGVPVIVVQVRAPFGPETRTSNVDVVLWTTLKLYTTVVDHLVLKYKISIAKSVPCPNCFQSKNRNTVLANGKPRKFFLEHLLRAREHQDLQCKACDVKIKSQALIGPVIDVSDLVPQHKRVVFKEKSFKEFMALETGQKITLEEADEHPVTDTEEGQDPTITQEETSGAVLKTTQDNSYKQVPFNRCLMCENCAVDGMDCDVNLKNGVQNWFCACGRDPGSCTFCRMCHTCCMYIKRIVCTVKPLFEMPKEERYNQDTMIALDTVKVREKGSLLEFYEEDVKFVLTQTLLTPSYTPQINFTLLREGHVTIQIKRTYPEATVISYESGTGCVYENSKEVLGKDLSRVMKRGQTISIIATFKKGDAAYMTIRLVLDGSEIYCTEAYSQRSLICFSDVSIGMFVEVETPGKFRPIHGVSYRTDCCCARAVKHFSSALDMWKLQRSVEGVCFGGRGISLSGSACVALPQTLSLDVLKYPRPKAFDNKNYHHLCLTWNPVSGKKAVHSTSLEAVQTIDPKYWGLKKLIHFIDSPGIPAAKYARLDRDAGFVLWAWHQVLASFPEMLLPDKTTHLFPPGVYTKQTELQVKEGLRSLVRLGAWLYFGATGYTALETVFKGHQRGKFKGEFLTSKSKLVAQSMNLLELQKDIQGPKLNEIYSKFNSSLTLYLCDAHGHCLRNKEGLTQVPPELYGDYSVFVSFIDVGNNLIESIPDTCFQNLPNLVDLNLSDNFISEIPASIKHCKKLNSLSVGENDLTDLPAELEELKQLVSLNAGGNRFRKVPEVVTKLKSLLVLELSHMMLTELPEDIGNLDQLKNLNLAGNCFTKLPANFVKLTSLEVLGLNGVPWMSVKSSGVVSYNQFRNFLQTSRMERYLEGNSEDKDELFRMFDENANGVLDLKEVGKLNAVIFNLFPRFGHKGNQPPDELTPHDFPMEILSCKNLKILHFSYHSFSKIPPEISQLQTLGTLSCGHNPYLISIPAELSLIPTLKRLDLDDSPNLKTPPREIREKGFQSVFAYLRRLIGGAVLSKRTKLMLVGLGGAGKTSLVKALLSDEGKADLQHGEAITDGIDINSWTLEHKGDEITYNVWDFAGQTVYYNTHQFFLSTNRAIYLLLWNVRLGHEHAGLDFWLSSVSVQAPDAPIFVIGSHIDQVNKTELPLEDMKQRYPQIAGFHFISNFTGQGIQELKENLFNVTLQQQYMGENIPAVWLTFEKNLEMLKAKENIVTYTAIEGIANRSGIFEPSEIFQAVQFLHDLGSVQHFTNEYLKSRVVVNPQWIVDVMACVVSVKTKVIENGRLDHKDLAVIWKEYPKSLHSWLLRLTEEFDLTFALKDKPMNLVPCLLPEKKPEITWEEIEKGSDIKENKMVYTFDYLPAGLFNRGQVRLHNLSDSALIWKKGSLLRKNVHMALLQQTRKGELVVIAQGPRPENILFLVHEVFEGLIAESYHGVKYDFSMPCPECQKMMVKDFHMFDASTIRRALDMKAPFLQCIKYFHTISCADLQTLLPPDTHSDFDAHLVQCVQGLKNLKKDLSTDIFISYCAADGNLDKNLYITPPQVHTDLVNKGYKCWYKEGSENQSVDDMAKALIDSSVFLAFVSTNYAMNEECINIFKYARLTLKKNIVVIAMGDGFEWKQSKLGILLADEVFVNMTKPKREFYDSKFDELLKSLSGKTRVVSETAIARPVVFISYTWVNSAQAVALGTREIPGALGYGDPRELKDYLEENAISCWLDVERVGMNGLFDDIAEGLLSAKVVIVCVSDEYATSPTCQIEFRYAANTLKLPIIIVVVGTGDMWRVTEVGLMSVHYPIVNMQEKTKKGKRKLLALVQDYLGHVDDVDGVATQKNEKNTANEKHKNLSYQELFELAQRKLLRQLSFYAENQDLDVYPRLFVLDFVKEGDKDTPNTNTQETEGEKDRVIEKPPVSRHSSTMLPAYKMEKFCVYTLCEHDEGWHSVSPPIQLPEDFGIASLDKYSPYLSRMTAVMKYNKSLQLECLSSDVGAEYVKWLEKSPDATMSDYQMVYHMLREMVMNEDVKNTMGRLKRCHLANGKTIWLCEHHQQAMGVTCLSSNEKEAIHKEKDKQLNDSMVIGLKTMDAQIVSSQFKCGGNAPRSRLHGKYGKPSRLLHAKKGKVKQKPKENKETNDETEEVATKPTTAEDEPPQTTTYLTGSNDGQQEPTPRKSSPAAASHTVDPKQEPKVPVQPQQPSGSRQAPAEMPLPRKIQRQMSRDSLMTPKSQSSLGKYERNRSSQQKKGPQTSRACVLS